MSVTRRQVIAGTIGGASLLATGVVGRYLLSSHLPVTYETAQLGGFPLLFSDKELGFQASVALLSAAGIFNNDQITQTFKNHFYLMAYNPDGQLKFKKEFILDSFRQDVVNFEDFGWFSLVVASALPERPDQLPQIDAMASCRHQTSFGEDGHHLQAIRENNQNSCHMIISSAPAEERLVSFFNPHPQALSGRIEGYDKHGKTIFSQDCKWGGFATQYLVTGESQHCPANAFRLNRPAGESVFLRVIGESTGRLLSSSWHYAKQSDCSFFTQSHGANFSLPANAGVAENEDKLFEHFSTARTLSQVNKTKEVFPGDFSSFAEDKWQTKIYIPNTTNRTLCTGIFAADGAGQLIANTFASEGPQIVPPRATAEFDLSKILKNPKDIGFTTLNCYVGAKVFSSYSLGKLVSTDSEGRRLYQHLRPHDGETTPQLYKSYFESTGNAVTDYWIGNVDFSKLTSVVGLIRNNSVRDEEQAEIHYYNKNQIVASHVLPMIKANGFIALPLPAANTLSNVGLRLTAPTGNLTISLLSSGVNSSYSIRHASGKLNRYPNLVQLKNWT